jgi:hypothetical protein
MFRPRIQNRNNNHSFHQGNLNTTNMQTILVTSEAAIIALITKRSNRQEIY